METVKITYGSDTVVMAWDGADASAPIVLDGSPTRYQTADARHRTELAVRLMCRLAWGEVVETEADASGKDPSTVCVWDDVGYITMTATREEMIAAVQAMAVNDATRELMSSGIVLTYDEADTLGGERIDWIQRRLGMTVEETDSGVVCAPRG